MIGGKALYPWQDYDLSKYEFIYLSLGAGVQSSTLFALSVLRAENVPAFDVAIFADTQDEPYWVYEHLWELVQWSGTRAKVEIVTEGQLSACDESFIRIPAFTAGDDGKSAITRRQCTREYKIAPINRKVRSLLGLEKGQRAKGIALSLQGISYDEMSRMKNPVDKFVDVEYPLIRMGWSRQHCETWWKANMPIPLPRKSACVYCPFRSNSEWRDLRDNDHAGWQFAIEYDHKIRNSTKAGIKRPAFLHRSLEPLEVVDFDKPDTGNLFENECEGMCGI